MKICALVCSTIACLVFSGMLSAHHSDRMIDSATTTWVSGTVVSYEPKNPHAMIDMEVVAEDGKINTWTIEGPRLLRVKGLGLEGDIVKAGDVITVCGFYPAADTFSRRTKPFFIHGKILITPDGQKWAWGPYGRLKNCVNEDDWDSIARGANPLRP